MFIIKVCAIDRKRFYDEYLKRFHFFLIYTRCIKSMANKKIAIIGTVVGLIAIAAWGKHVFTGTPRYSLGQLQQAIKEQDATAIEEYVDTEAIATQIVDVSLASAQQQAIEQNDIFGMLGNSLGLVEMLRPQMQTQIEKAIERGLQELGEQDLQELKLTSIERNDKTATATFDLSKQGNKDMPFKAIEINMKQQNDRQWQIVGLSKESLKEVAESIK